MPFVEMKCPNCGAPMKLENNQLVCPHCSTMMLNIVDAKIDKDVTVMNPKEFADMIEKAKKQFVVKINDNYELFDVDVKVANKKISDATQFLNEGYFSEVLEVLEGLPENILSVERLRLLATCNAKNEYELSLYEGLIDDIGKTNKRNSYVRNILKLSDAQTKETYKKLIAYCREQYEIKKTMEKEVRKGKDLVDAGLYDDARLYIKEMCQKYPSNAYSWAYACEIKKMIKMDEDIEDECSKMLMCSDFEKIELPPILKGLIEPIHSFLQGYTEKEKSIMKKGEIMEYATYKYNYKRYLFSCVRRYIVSVLFGLLTGLSIFLLKTIIDSIPLQKISPVIYFLAILFLMIFLLGCTSYAFSMNKFILDDERHIKNRHILIPYNFDFFVDNGKIGTYIGDLYDICNFFHITKIVTNYRIEKKYTIFFKPFCRQSNKVMYITAIVCITIFVIVGLIMI